MLEVEVELVEEEELELEVELVELEVLEVELEELELDELELLVLLVEVEDELDELEVLEVEVEVEVAITVPQKPVPSWIYKIPFVWSKYQSPATGVGSVGSIWRTLTK